MTGKPFLHLVPFMTLTGVLATVAVRPFAAGLANPSPSIASSASQRPYGMGNPAFSQITGTSCAAASCHGGDLGTTGGEYHTWAPEVFPKGPADPHSRAYRVLFNEQSQRMVALLRIPTAAHQTELCLKCHAVDGVSAPEAHAEGVSCGACHGPAEAWLTVHYLPFWKGLSHQEKFERYGYVPTKNLVSRIANCTQCHVGAADREVNHDLIAAGHPRLAFEYTRFHYHPNYRKHWVEATARADFEPKAWLIGQVTTLRAAVDLLVTRAARAMSDDPSSAWPEFAGYSCYSCHQTIGTGDLRRAVGKVDRKPGSLAWELWSTATVTVAMHQTRALFPDLPTATCPELATLQKLMESLNPSPRLVYDQARKARAELDSWLAKLQSADDQRVVLPPKTPRILTHALAANVLTSDKLQLRDHDWDFVSAHYLGIAAMYHAAGGASEHEQWRPLVLNLAKVLRFPPPTRRGTETYDSPAGFGPRQQELARDYFQSLLDATASPGVP